MYMEVVLCEAPKKGIITNNGIQMNARTHQMNDPKRGAAFTNGVETQPLLFVV